MQERVMQQILDESYEDAENNPDFTALVDSQGLGRDDRKIPAVVYNVYDRAICHLNPKKWLKWCADSCDVSGKTDVGETVWGRYIIDELHHALDLHIDAMKKCAELVTAAEGMEKPAALLSDTITQLQLLRDSNTWDEIYRRKNIDYGTLRFGKNCTDEELIGKIKAVRGACKSEIDEKTHHFTADN